MNNNTWHKNVLRSIEVPGHWQLQLPGDTPEYNNIKFPIPVSPPSVPTNNPTGYYQRTFTLNEEWFQKSIILYFGAVDNCFYVWVNKKFVGFSKDSRLPAEFNITNVVKKGYNNNINLLEVIVIKYSDAYYLEGNKLFCLICANCFRRIIV